MENKMFSDEQSSQDKIAVEQKGVVLFESAYNKIASILKNSNKILKISLEATGCAGVSYSAQLVDEIIPDDVVINFGNEIKLLVSDTKRFPSDDDPDLLYSDWDFLEGLHLKYKETLMNSSFEMENPNALRGCSCGISFKPRGYGGKPQNCR